MIKKISAILMICFSSHTLFAQTSSEYQDARSIALSNAVCASDGLINAASMSLPENSYISLSYDNKYITKELSSTTFAGLYKLKFIDFSVLANYFGYEYYNKLHISINASKYLFNRFILGLRIGYSSFNFSSESGVSDLLDVSLGGIFIVNENLRIGLSGSNLLKARLDKNYDPLSLNLPFRLDAGLEFKVIDEMCLFFQVSKSEDVDFTIHFGGEYIVNEKFPLRIGFSGAPFSPSFGTGFLFDNFDLSVAALYNLKLGISPSVSLKYMWR
ncbi:MAG: hypothetical protein ACRCX5_13825 [Bacteroidales bacterium]